MSLAKQVQWCYKSMLLVIEANEATLGLIGMIGAVCFQGPQYLKLAARDLVTYHQRLASKSRYFLR